MCLVLPAKVVGLGDERADIELHGGTRTTASRVLQPGLRVGDHVLVDRGLVVRVIEPAEAEAILAVYAEIGDLLAKADA